MHKIAILGVNKEWVGWRKSALFPITDWHWYFFIFKEKITLFYNFHKTLQEILLSFYPSGASLLKSSKLGHVTSGLWERGCAYTCGSETRSIWFPWSKCSNNISRNTNRYFGVIYFQKIFVLLANVSKPKVTPSKLGLSRIYICSTGL